MKYDSHNNVILNVFSLKDEVYELRDQQKHMLGGSSESLSLMYSSLLRKYEVRKEECDKIARAHTEAVTQAEQYQDQLNQYKASYENMVNERNKYKQQCTQVKHKHFSNAPSCPHVSFRRFDNGIRHWRRKIT